MCAQYNFTALVIPFVIPAIEQTANAFPTIKTLDVLSAEITDKKTPPGATEWASELKAFIKDLELFCLAYHTRTCLFFSKSRQTLRLRRSQTKKAGPLLPSMKVVPIRFYSTPA